MRIVFLMPQSWGIRFKTVECSFRFHSSSCITASYNDNPVRCVQIESGWGTHPKTPSRIGPAPVFGQLDKANRAAVRLIHDTMRSLHRITPDFRVLFYSCFCQHCFHYHWHWHYPGYRHYFRYYRYRYHSPCCLYYCYRFRYCRCFPGCCLCPSPYF